MYNKRIFFSPQSCLYFLQTAKSSPKNPKIMSSAFYVKKTNLMTSSHYVPRMGVTPVPQRLQEIKQNFATTFHMHPDYIL